MHKDIKTQIENLARENPNCVFITLQVKEILPGRVICFSSVIGKMGEMRKEEAIAVLSSLQDSWNYIFQRLFPKATGFDCQEIVEN